MVIQGRFRRTLPFAEVYTGQEFAHPVASKKEAYIRAALGVTRLASPLLEAHFERHDEAAAATGERRPTFLLSPLVPTVKRMHGPD